MSMRYTDLGIGHARPRESKPLASRWGVSWAEEDGYESNEDEPQITAASSDNDEEGIDLEDLEPLVLNSDDSDSASIDDSDGVGNDEDTQCGHKGLSGSVTVLNWGGEFLYPSCNVGVEYW